MFEYKINTAVNDKNNLSKLDIEKFFILLNKSIKNKAIRGTSS